MSIAYLISWTGTAKPSDFQVETFKSRTDAVGAQAILEHKTLERTALAIDEVDGLAGLGSSFLVALYNSITNGSQKSFHDANSGRKKVWEALSTKYPDPNPGQPEQAQSDQAEGDDAEGAASSNMENDMATKTAKKTKTAKAPKAPKAPKEKKGPGVIDTIVDLLTGKGGTIAELHTKLAAKFPDKDKDGLLSTLKIQVNRLSKSKDEGGRGLKIKKEAVEGSNEKWYSI